MDGTISIRDIEPSDSEYLRTYLMEHLGYTRVVSRGVMHQANQLPGLIALYDGVPSLRLSRCMQLVLGWG